MSPANNHLYAQQKNILKCFRSQPHHIVSNWINMTQTITVFHSSPANFCNILMTGAKKTKSNPRVLWPLRHSTRVMRGHDLTNKNTMTKTKTMTMTNTFREDPQRATQDTCDIWDTDYNSENWEPESMTIFVTWQLRVTLDSIRNSCDVW